MTQQADAVDLVARISADSIALWRTLGIRVDRVERQGHVILSLDMRPELGTRRPEVMHGGVISSLIDAAAGAAVSTTHAESDATWQGQATLDLNVTFLGAVTGAVLAESRILRQSASLAFVTVDVRDAAGALMATGRATYSIIRRR